MDKYNVVIDTNVIVSVLISHKKESSTYKVLELVFNKNINCYYTDDILSEYKDVLNRDKFNFDKGMVNEFLEEFINTSNRINLKNIDKIDSKINEVIDKKDIPFYKIVTCDKIKDCYLITGNKKHFPTNDHILTPSEFLTQYKY